ncbi:MAG: hypothetical protein NC548_38915 [Lachnospiraceae bacterium]|nr:hypothetical protein [Lachnospiraceae bacterium]
MVNECSFGKTKKSLDDKFLKFIKRLNTINERWIIVNDMWIPADRTEKTRPGLHIARNPALSQLDTDMFNTAYMTEPIPEILAEIESITRDKDEVFYVRTQEMITLEFKDTIVVTARAMWPDDAEEKIPGYLYGNTFRGLEDSLTWTPISKDTLVSLRNGNLFQIVEGGLVIMRLVRSHFKLRGRSERTNAEVNYTAKYAIERYDDTEVISTLTVGFSLFVDYGFIQSIHRYINIPYPEGVSMNPLDGSFDLGLFDEDGADDGLEVVD